MGVCLGEVVLIGTDLEMVKDETSLLLLIDGPHRESSFQVRETRQRHQCIHITLNRFRQVQEEALWILAEKEAGAGVITLSWLGGFYDKYGSWMGFEE